MAIAVTLQSTPAEWKHWGCETLEAIRSELYLPKRKLYAEDSTKKQVSFNWPSGVMLSALNAGARVEAKYKPWLREYADAMRVYWHADGGYDVLPVPKTPDRYYDDNAWMALALIETSDILGDKKYLDWAEQTVAFILTGEDDKLGGGLYWREQEKLSKNTCANAPSALACLRLYTLTKKKSYLDAGRRLYSWTQAHLQDPASTLYWDNISLQGKVDKTTWSYNTALMMKAGKLLRELDGNAKVGADPLPAARAKWLDAKVGLIKDDMAFAHLFFEAHLDRGFTDCGIYLRGLHDKARDGNGHYGHRWDGIAKETRKPWRLIDQASAARAYFTAALVAR